MSTLTKTQKVTSVAAAVSAALAGYTTTQAQLEEIVVTATKKAESLQDIAGSVQAITEDQLKKAQVVNMEDY
ncbi:MAG: hypothetical protein MK217_05795, partial [Gammaproteobacteria bacterium]|nr:hypothetical protein [Gammaproteobacteria bacterium]